MALRATADRTLTICECRYDGYPIRTFKRASALEHRSKHRMLDLVVLQHDRECLRVQPPGWSRGTALRPSMAGETLQLRHFDGMMVVVERRHRGAWMQALMSIALDQHRPQ
jgi:hypothetical protein